MAILHSLSTAHQFGTYLSWNSGIFSLLFSKAAQASSLSFVACVVSLQRPPQSPHSLSTSLFFSLNSCSLLGFLGCPNRSSDDSLHPFLPFHLLCPIWGRCTISTASLFHSLLSLYSSVPPSFSLVLFLSPALFQKKEAQWVTMEKIAQVDHSKCSFLKNLQNGPIG